MVKDWEAVFKKIETEGGFDATFVFYGLDVDDDDVQLLIEQYRAAYYALEEALDVQGYQDYQEENT